MTKVLEKGGVNASSFDGGAVAITLSGSAGSAVGALLVARAPATGIKIDERVLSQVSPALNNDVIVGTFGHAPVTIQLSGLELIAACLSSDSDVRDISECFDRFNAHSDPDARIDVTVGTALYTCILLAHTLAVRGTADEQGAGASRWELLLLGVRAK